MTGAPATVVHVITRLDLGGAQQNTLDTIRGLDRERFAPHLVCGAGGELGDEARALGVPFTILERLVHPVRPMADLAAVAELRGYLETARAAAPDAPMIVHTHSSKAGVIGRMAAIRARVRPVIHSIHGFGYDALRPTMRPLALRVDRWLGRRTDAFISVARHHVDEGLRLGLLTAERTRVIRSGFDLAAFASTSQRRRDARARLGYGDDEPLVGMIGNMRRQKNPLEFVAIAGAVRARVPTARFFLTGEGPLRADVEAAIAASPQLDAESFRLLGWRDDVPDLLAALDVAALTSTWEGLPRSVPQAMAAGRPVVATRVDGTPEALVDGRHGFLYEPGDVDAATDAIVRLLDDPELRARLGAHGPDDARPWDVARMVREQETLYDELLTDVSRRRS